MEEVWTSRRWTRETEPVGAGPSYEGHLRPHSRDEGKVSGLTARMIEGWWAKDGEFHFTHYGNSVTMSLISLLGKLNILSTLPQ